MDKEWVIKEVGGISDSTYGKKFNVKLEGYEFAVSGFTKWPENIVVGAKVYGRVEVKGQYHNFKFGKKAVGEDRGPANRDAGLAELKNLLTLKIIPMLEAIHKEQVIIQGRLDKE